MQVGVAGYNLPGKDVKLPAVKYRYLPSGFDHQERSRGNIPGLNPCLDITVKDPPGDETEVQRRRTVPPDPLRSVDTVFQDRQEPFFLLPALIAKSGHKEGLPQIPLPGNGESLSVAKGPLPRFGQIHLVKQGRVDAGGNRYRFALIELHAGDGNAAEGKAVDKIGRAVDRVHHKDPSVDDAGATAFFSDKAVIGKRLL